MKSWKWITLFTAFLLIFSGCVGSVPAPQQEAAIDTTLPMVKITKNGILSDMQTVAFEWNSINDPRVKGIYIYKATLGKKSTPLKYFKTIKGRFSTHFIDEDIRPDTEYAYSFKTFSAEAEGRETPIIKVHSLPVLKSIAWIYGKTGMPRTAKIIWRPHNNHGVKSYLIERKTVEDKKWKKLATVEGRLNAEYIDGDLDDNHVYQYRIRVQTYDGIISSPSQEVKIVTKALPKSIRTIKVSKSLPKKIKISWEKSKAKDFSQYYLYRSENIDGSYKLIAKLYNNHFIDKIDEDGQVYFYKISVIDKDGLESLHDKLSAKGQTLAKPEAPQLMQATLTTNSIHVTWNKTDTRSRSFVLVRKYKKGWFKTITQEFKGLKNTQYIDTNIVPNSQYTYTVYSVDKYGIVSNPSKEVTVVTPESDKVIVQAKVEDKQESKVQETKVDNTEEMIAPVSDLSVDEH